CGRLTSTRSSPSGASSWSAWSSRRWARRSSVTSPPATPRRRPSSSTPRTWRSFQTRRLTAMALSNRDRIGQMVDLLAPALDQFIAGVLSSHLQPGSDWTQLVAARDARNGITGKQYSARDLQVQLRLLTENITSQVRQGWYPFDGRL